MIYWLGLAINVGLHTYTYIHFYILGMYTTEDMKGAVSSEFCLGFFFTTKEHTPVPNMAFELIEIFDFKGPSLAHFPFSPVGPSPRRPAKLVSFRYNRTRNRKEIRNYPKQKDLFRFFQNIPKLERFVSFGCFGSTKNEPKEPK